VSPSSVFHIAVPVAAPPCGECVYATRSDERLYSTNLATIIIRVVLWLQEAIIATLRSRTYAVRVWDRGAASRQNLLFVNCVAKL
jgi:hypothetical protein